MPGQRRAAARGLHDAVRHRKCLSEVAVGEDECHASGEGVELKVIVTGYRRGRVVAMYEWGGYAMGGRQYATKWAVGEDERHGTGVELKVVRRLGSSEGCGVFCEWCAMGCMYQCTHEKMNATLVEQEWNSKS